MEAIGQLIVSSLPHIGHIAGKSGIDGHGQRQDPNGRFRCSGHIGRQGMSQRGFIGPFSIVIMAQSRIGIADDVMGKALHRRRTVPHRFLGKLAVRPIDGL